MITHFQDIFFQDIEADPITFRIKSDIINHPRKHTLEDFCNYFGYTKPSYEIPDGWRWAREHFDKLKHVYMSYLPRYVRRADQKQRVLGDFRHPALTEKALSYRHVDPQFKYGAVKICDGDCDFEWSQEWEDKARPTILVRTFPSPNFHAQWFCNEYLSRAERHLVQYYFKIKFHVDVSSSGNLLTSPCLNKPRRKNLELRNKNGIIEPLADECIFRIPNDARIYSKAELFALLGIKMKLAVVGDKIITKPATPVMKMLNTAINPCLDVFLDELVSLSPRQKAIAILNYESSVEEGQRYNNMRDVTCRLAYRLFHTEEWCFDNVVDIARNNSSDLTDGEIKSTAVWVFNRVENMKWEKNGEKPHDVNVRWRIAREDGQLQVDYARETMTPIWKVYYMVRKKQLVSYLSRWMKKEEYEDTLIAEDIVSGSKVFNKFDLKEHELTTGNKSSVSTLFSYTYPSLPKRAEDDNICLSENVNHMEVEIDPPIPKKASLWPKLPDYILAELEKYEARKKQNV
jgi:hypothetical protein